MDEDIKFAVIGISTAIKQNSFVVPSNQREYSWLADAQVTSFLRDISSALRKPDKSYFLGTVVLTKREDKRLSIADGQQRLATTSMLLAAIRDWFRKKGHTDDYKSIETDYLFTYDRKMGETISKLILNVDDNEYFKTKILHPNQKSLNVIDPRRSHKLISKAAQTIKEYIDDIEKQHGPANAKKVFHDWMEYLDTNAKIVMLTVSDEENAFLMFETLNDRGLKTSQVDLVKNHMFNMAGDRLGEAQKLWSSMKSSIESVSDDDDITIDFLRSACILMAGLTTKKEIMKTVQENTQSKTDAIKMLTFYDELSKIYAAILNPDHPKWNSYNPDVRKSIQAINLMGISQIRPLMLSVATYLNKENTATAFKKLVSWSVRFMVMGYRGGRLDEGYSKLANKIYTKEIKNDEDLKRESEKTVIKDAEFKQAFENVSVSKSVIARYYLRSLETTARQEKDPEFIPNDDPIINLEHIMPQSLNDNWKHIKQQDLETHLTRLGNLALLQSSKNSDIGNSSFEDKQIVFKKSSFLLTKQLGDLNVKWDIKQIENRQKVLAELAVKTWQL
jgi:Protein of unknown function DUF262/Protein of unknown function (DUF1524)